MPAWNVKGQYYETCSCDFVCPCLPGGMAVKPTRGWCTFAMAFQIERGAYGDVALDDLGFIVLAHTRMDSSVTASRAGFVSGRMSPKSARGDCRGAVWPNGHSGF